MAKLFVNLGAASRDLDTAKNRCKSFAVLELETDGFSWSNPNITECKLCAVHGLKPKPPVVTKLYRGRLSDSYSDATALTLDLCRVRNSSYAGVLEETYHDGVLVSTRYIPKTDGKE